MSPQENTTATIGKSVEIRGEVKGSEDLLVDGRVEGTIALTQSRLTIGSHAEVEANISARDVVIAGLVKGDVQASGRVELRKGCNLTGAVIADRLSIEENAIFHGRVELTRNEKPTPQPAAPSTPSAEPPMVGVTTRK